MPSFGVTTTQAGRSPSSSWWSVTMTSIPSAWARATSARALMPQSTVISSLTPAAPSSSTAVGGDAVALAEAVGEAPAHVGAELLEEADQEERRGDAVGVVVAVHGDGLAAAQRLVDALPRLGHAAHEVRVVNAEVRMQKGPRRGGIAEPAAHEHLGEDLAHPELSGESPDLRERRRRDTPGAWIGHECITPPVYRPRTTDADAGGRDSGGGRRRIVAGVAGPRVLAGLRRRLRGVAGSPAASPAMVTAVASPASPDSTPSVTSASASPAPVSAPATAVAASPATTVAAASSTAPPAPSPLSTTVTASALSTIVAASSPGATTVASPAATSSAVSRDGGRSDGVRLRGRVRRGPDRQRLSLAEALVRGLELGLELAPLAEHGRPRQVGGDEADDEHEGGDHRGHPQERDGSGGAGDVVDVEDDPVVQRSADQDQQGDGGEKDERVAHEGPPVVSVAAEYTNHARR